MLAKVFRAAFSVVSRQCFFVPFYVFFSCFLFLFCSCFLCRVCCFFFENCIFWGCLPLKRSVLGGFRLFSHSPFRGVAKKGLLRVHSSKGGFFGVSAFIVSLPETTTFKGVSARHRFWGVGVPKLQTTSANRKK